jgi:6-phosphogluconolactonase (cycloisomerase 2 family)
MKFRWFAIVLVLLLVVISISCSNNNNSSATSGTGFLWLAAQGNTTVQAYTINLSSGSLSLNSNAVVTGNAPSSILITPKADAAFIANSGTSAPSSPGGISAYTVNSNGTLTVAETITGVIDAVPSPNTDTCANPMGLAIDPGGKFLFVACQGTFSDPNSGAVFVFSISGTSLAPVGVRTPTNFGSSTGSGAVALAVSASGNYLYVANQFANTVSSFQISSSGGLTAKNSYSVGISPSAVFLSVGQGTIPAGLFLYVANTGSNNISAFSVCDAQSAFGCSTPNGVLAQVTGSPFPAQPGPVAIAMDPSAPFLYVADQQANQISQYSWSSGTGALTPLGVPTISAAGQPVSLAIRSGIGVTSTTVGIDYLYVANFNGSSISIYSLNTTNGVLNVLGSPVTTFSQPSAIAVR